MDDMALLTMLQTPVRILAEMANRTGRPYMLRWQVFKRDHYTCQYCGRRAPDVSLTVDHKIPVSAGGTDDFENLITACTACNMGKSNEWEFMGVQIRPRHGKKPVAMDGIIQFLKDKGPATATQIAVALKLDVGNTSRRLRQHPNIVKNHRAKEGVFYCFLEP